MSFFNGLRHSHLQQDRSSLSRIKWTLQSSYQIYRRRVTRSMVWSAWRTIIWCFARGKQDTENFRFIWKRDCLTYVDWSISAHKAKKSWTWKRCCIFLPSWRTSKYERCVPKEFFWTKEQFELLPTGIIRIIFNVLLSKSVLIEKQPGLRVRKSYADYVKNIKFNGATIKRRVSSIDLNGIESNNEFKNWLLAQHENICVRHQQVKRWKRSSLGGQASLGDVSKPYAKKN